MVNHCRTTPIFIELFSVVAATKFFTPLITSRTFAASKTFLASGPGESWLKLIGITPLVETRPTVGLIPTIPFNDAGQTIDPSVSVPIATGINPAATAEPDPDELPPALCENFHGFAVRPPIADQPLVDSPERIFAHSDKFVLPKIIAPAFFNSVTNGASDVIGRPTKESEPAVPGKPIASMLSLIKTGIPLSGLSGLNSVWPVSAESFMANTDFNPPGGSSISITRVTSSAMSSFGLITFSARSLVSSVIELKPSSSLGPKDLFTP